MTGANVGSPGNSTELSQHETQISNITYYNNCCPPFIPPVIFKTIECCRKAHFGGAILSPFFLSIAEKRFLTSSPNRRFFFIRRMSPKKFFCTKSVLTSSPFYCESPKNVEISRLRRQSLVIKPSKNRTYESAPLVRSDLSGQNQLNYRPLPMK